MTGPTGPAGSQGNSLPGPIGPKGPAGPTGPTSEIETKRKWVYQPKIRTFFWDRGFYDRMLNRKLENDDEFVEWCWQYDCNVDGTWVECPDDETALIFSLRWC